MGLMQGVELVMDETTQDRTPNPQALARLFEETSKRGLLIGKGGLYGNVARISPPLIATEDDVRRGGRHPRRGACATWGRRDGPPGGARATAGTPPPRPQAGLHRPDRPWSRRTAASTATTRRASRRARPASTFPSFIRKIATGNLRGSARTILSANLLGYSCARVCPVEVLCAGACVYNHLEREPIAIGRLQRHAVERPGGRRGRRGSVAPPAGQRPQGRVASARGRPRWPALATSRSRAFDCHALREARAARRAQHHRRGALQDARRGRAARGRSDPRSRRDDPHRRRGRSRRDGRRSC